MLGVQNKVARMQHHILICLQILVPCSDWTIIWLSVKINNNGLKIASVSRRKRVVIWFLCAMDLQMFKFIRIVSSLWGYNIVETLKMAVQMCTMKSWVEDPVSRPMKSRNNLNLGSYFMMLWFTNCLTLDASLIR